MFVKKEKMAEFVIDYKEARARATSNGGNGFDLIKPGSVLMNLMKLTKQIDTYDSTIEVVTDHSSNCNSILAVKGLLPQRVPLQALELKYFFTIASSLQIQTIAYQPTSGQCRECDEASQASSSRQRRPGCIASTWSIGNRGPTSRKTTKHRGL